MSKKTTLYLVLTIILIIVSGYFMLSFSEDKKNLSAQKEDGTVQKVVLSLKNSNYYPNTIKAKEGQPVSITLDNSIQGCLRAFTIRDLGVSTYSPNPSQTIDFTPTQKGTFRFSCSMGMGYGTIIVE